MSAKIPRYSTYLKWEGQLLQLRLPLLEHEVALVLLDEVHLVDEAEDLGLGREGDDGLEAALVVVHVLLQLAALHVKHVDENLTKCCMSKIVPKQLF